MLKDTESLDYLFCRTFGGDVFDRGTDFPFIALDFFRHIYPEIEKYSNYAYTDDSMDKWSPLTGLRCKIMNAMLAAARHGHEYAVEMLCRLYKTYYKREYNQLKRFKSISYDELVGFDNEEELFSETAARILTICPFMGIRIESDCAFVIGELKEDLEEETFEYKLSPKPYVIEEDLLRESLEEAQALIQRKDNCGRDRMWYYLGEIPKFKQRVFNYYSMPQDYDLYCDTDTDRLGRRIAITIAILKKTSRKRTYSDDEILLYHGMFDLIRSFTSQIADLNEWTDMMLGRTDKYEFEIERCRYRPQQQKVATSAAYISEQIRAAQLKPGMGKADQKSPGRQAQTEEKALFAEEREDYLTRINDLEAELKLKHQDVKDLQKRYAAIKEKEQQNRIDEETLEAQRQELAHLREYVYGLTEEDIVSESISCEEMEERIRDRKIIIVGGHENWVNYLKEKFPDWTYIKPSISNTLPESAAAGAEFLFFFTDTLSHGSFSRYMNVVRKHGVPYSYLHGTNIEKTVRSIYRALNPGERAMR